MGPLTDTIDPVDKYSYLGEKLTHLNKFIKLCFLLQLSAQSN